MNGSNTYKLHLPPNPPAALFWAVTAYNITDGTMPETKQLLPSTNGCYDIPKNKDASIDIWFGPKKPDGVADPASIETIPAATSWWRYGSTDRASSSMTRPGSPTTS